MKIKALFFKNILLIWWLIFSALGSQSQQFQFTDIKILERVKLDVMALAHDSMEGREMGTRGEKKAASYIAGQFMKAGIQPFFSGENFSYDFEESMLDNSNYLIERKLVVNDKNYDYLLEFYPIAFSGSNSVSGELVNVGYGIEADELGYTDYSWETVLTGKIFVIETSVPGGYSKRSKFKNYFNLKKKIDLAIKKGAKGIIFVNSDRRMANPTHSVRKRLGKYTIPIVFFNERPALLFSHQNGNQAEISVKFQKIATFKGILVAGLIDNHAPQTIVIGAHYDHIGIMRKNGKKAINNGADDNASGTAAVIELARYVKNTGLKNYNYIFIAFSGEEKGLLGSKYFASSNTIKKYNIVAMLNFDMVGRFDSNHKKIYIFGTASSPLWNDLIRKNADRNFKVRKIRGSVPFSDQHSFYVKQVPVLFFYTGTHPDYHTPRDRSRLVNYQGEVKVIQFAEKIIAQLDQHKNIKFSKVSPFFEYLDIAGILLGIY